MAGLRKTLFRSPEEDKEAKNLKSSDDIETLLNKIQVEVEVENNLNIVEKELHEKRLTKMKQHLDTMKQDEWKYPKIEQLIGF